MTPRPARNRVTPLGEIIAVQGRGAWMGNRGRLHEGGAVVPPIALCATISTRPGSPVSCRSGAGACRNGSPTAPSTVDILRAGCAVQIDDSAR